MFNKNVTSVLQQVNVITNSVILKYPQTVAVSKTGDVMFLVDVSKLDTEPFPDVPVMESLSELLNIFKLFPDDRSVQVNGNVLNISSGKMSTSFILSNPSLMDSFDRSPTMFESTDAVPSVAEFELSPDDIKAIKGASGVFGDLDEVIFESKDGEVSMSLGATDKFNARSNTFRIEKHAVTNKDFKIRIPVENFKGIPLSSYTFAVKYNSARDSYRILMKNKTIEGLEMLMSVKA